MLDGFAEYGYWGLLIASFLAATVLPFSSEVVFAALVASGLDIWQCIFYRSEEHTSELQSRPHLVCRLLLEKKKKTQVKSTSSPHKHLTKPPIAKTSSQLTAQHLPVIHCHETLSTQINRRKANEKNHTTTRI